jgi:hypothetical protein
MISVAGSGPSLRRYLWRAPETAVVAVWLSANLLVFGTHATYAVNQDMLGISFWSLVQTYYLWPFLQLTLALVGLGLLVPTHALYRIYVVLLFSVALMIWAQGSFFVWNYGLFDGNTIDFTAHRWTGVAELLVWLGVFAFLLWQRKWLHRHVAFVAGTFCLLQSLLLVPALLPSGAANPTDGAASASLPTLREHPNSVFDFSPSGNVIVYISDGFQADIFQEIIEGHEDFAQHLDGFIWFTDVSSNSKSTVGVYPAMLTGVIYDGAAPFASYTQQTIRDDNIALALQRAGFTVAHVVSSINLYFQPEHYISPFRFVERFSAKDLASRTLLDATLFRHSPHVFKPFVYDGVDGVASALLESPLRLIENGNETTAYLDFMNVMDLRMRRWEGPPTFKLFHLLNAHTPLSLNEHCEYERLSTKRVNYVRTNICSMKLFLRFLSKLHALGVYDSSSIIFAGDHGTRGQGTGIASVAHGLEIGDAWPALIIKPAGSRGPLRVSHAQAELADVAATIVQLTGIDAVFPGRSLLSLREAEERTRYFYLGKPGEPWWRMPDRPSMTGFAIRGPVRERASWSPVEPDDAVVHASSPAG